MTKTRRVARKIWRYRRRRLGVVETFKQYLFVCQFERVKWMRQFKRWKSSKISRHFNPATFQYYPQRLFDKGHLNKSKHDIKRDGIKGLR